MPVAIQLEDLLIEIRNLNFSFGGNQLYDGLNVGIPRRKVTAIMGPSGCGKSTLLNFIGGRLRPHRGDVLVNSESVPSLNRTDLFALRKQMGMMFQSSALLTDLNVFENVAFPMREHTELPEPLIKTLVLSKLQMVGLRGARNLMPAQLSGGMTRRVALARAIALDPLLVMYDEPFTGLDPISMGIIAKLIREVNDALEMTSVIVTHDVAEACSIADYIYLLGHKKVVAHGTPEQMRNTESDDARQFMAGLPDGPVAYHYPARDYREDLFQDGLDE